MNATIRRAQLLAHEHDLEISPSRVSRIVRRHAATGTPSAEHLVRCLRAYSDPTGDTAVRNAMKTAPGSGCTRPEAKTQSIL